MLIHGKKTSFEAQNRIGGVIRYALLIQTHFLLVLQCKRPEADGLRSRVQLLARRPGQRGWALRSGHGDPRRLRGALWPTRPQLRPLHGQRWRRENDRAVELRLHFPSTGRGTGFPQPSCRAAYTVRRHWHGTGTPRFCYAGTSLMLIR